MLTAAFARTAAAAAAASSSRQVVVRAASASAAAAARATRASSFLPQASAAAAARLSPPSLFAVRTYASSGGPSVEDIEKRIRDVLASFEKVKASAITPSASFTSDLGLDSLDAVEVVMAIEEEFNIEIPDEEADNITTVQQAIDYVSHAPEAV
ncbi:mitochondrial acyl carrier protein [Tilletia horrida]|uniref:Acyl carrier protein n=1 Tax=Tilletia horrida TaxID=155126 RepID=A0AAN6JQH2_9BASI|nr:mitochondrial acyl carrier protein [Tilletia horrida]